MEHPHLGVMTLHFQVYGCETVRDKKRVFSAMRRIWGREPDLAVAEIADQDDPGLATWSVVTTGPDPRLLQHRLQEVEKAILARIDAPILDTQVEID
ncbi:DUF503 family protein [Halospina sp. K52047b]|jgi:uncharacterized protein YlxP (DUF503 family)|uniref:DUF503 family protein n=1 Tax=Halospina sp. K52047b TaxID=2614160 RepID=UPI00124A4CB3|nr:DUF503 family protein [Halospina sp. K52047b]KAA8983468.1 DUF503 domain-containing protein [Halospina sp. K52047b]